MKSGWMEKNVSSALLFLCGVILVPSFLLQKLLVIKALQSLLYAGLCILSGCRVVIIRSFLFLLAVTFFSLLTPAGRVLLRLGPFSITELALEEGLFRGLTVIGLFYLSRFCIRADLRLPGRFGRLLSSTFFYYYLMLEESAVYQKEASGAGLASNAAGAKLTENSACVDSGSKSRNSRNLVVFLDAILMRAYYRSPADKIKVSTSQTSPGGIIVVSVLLLSNWALTLISLFIARLFS